MTRNNSNTPDPMDTITNLPEWLYDDKKKGEFMSGKDDTGSGKWVADRVSSSFSERYQIAEDANVIEAELRAGMLSEERAVELIRGGMGELVAAYVSSIPATKEVLKAIIEDTDETEWQSIAVLEHFENFFDDEIAQVILQEGGRFFVREYMYSFPFVDSEGKTRLSREMEQRLTQQ